MLHVSCATSGCSPQALPTAVSVGLPGSRVLTLRCLLCGPRLPPRACLLRTDTSSHGSIVCDGCAAVEEVWCCIS
eukprot:3010979-Rhodomonas_salina.1